MPSRTLHTLPDGVRHVLPRAAQEIYRQVFNSAWMTCSGRESRAGLAHRVAGSAVQKSCRQQGETWVRRQSSATTAHGHGACVTIFIQGGSTVDAGFWLERWEQNQIGFHQNEINSHLQEYWPRLQLPAGSPVFVPLCGKSRDLLWLRAQGHPVLGVEVSPIAVRDFFNENRLTAQVSAQGKFDRWEADGLVVLRGDFFDLPPALLTAVTAVYDRASLIALPPDMRARYVHKLREILPPAFRMLLVTMEYDPGEMSGPPFAVSEAEVRSLYEPALTVERLRTHDVLSDSPRFRERGLTRLDEQVFLLQSP